MYTPGEIVADSFGKLYKLGTQGKTLVGLDLSFCGISEGNSHLTNGDLIRDAIDSLDDAPVPIYGAGGTFDVAGTISIPSTCPLFEGNGMVLNWQGATGGSYIQPTGVNTDSLLLMAGSFTPQDGLLSDVFKGGTSITLTDTPVDVVPGSWLRLVDKAVLFNGFRSSYYTGEDIQVLEVSGDTITFMTALKFGYTAAGTVVNLMNTTNTVVRNVRVIGRGDGTGSDFDAGIRVYVGGPGFVLDNCSSSMSDYAALEMPYCVGSKVNFGEYYNTANYGGSDNYAITLPNCTDVTVNGTRSGCYFNGTDFGGYNTDYGSVNYNCRFVDAYSEVFANSSNPGFAFNMHGNCLNCGFIDVSSTGPITFGGENSIVKADIYSGENYGALPFSIIGTEFVSTNHNIEATVVYSGGTQNVSYGTVFDCGGGGSTITADTTRGGVLRAKLFVKYYADYTNSLATSCIVNVSNNGSTPDIATTVDLSGSVFTFQGKNASVTACGRIFCRVQSGDNFNYNFNDVSGQAIIDVRNPINFTAVPITLDSSGLGSTSGVTIGLSSVSGTGAIVMNPTVRGSVVGAISISGSGTNYVEINNPMLAGYTGTGISVNLGTGGGTGASVWINGGIIPVAGTNISISGNCASGYVVPGMYAGSVSNSASTARAYAGQLPTTTFASLPSATVYIAGTRCEITDCNTSTYNAAAAGGGATRIGVVTRNGAWVVG